MPIPRTAVLLRTHLVNEKVFDLISILKKSNQYDLYISADETNGPLNFCDIKKITNDRRLCPSLGLLDNPNVFWHCGDYAFYFAIDQIPDYEYYILVEYDVDFVRKNPLFLEGIISRLQCVDGSSFDFLSPHLHRAYPEWGWYDSVKSVFPEVWNTGIFGFVVASKKAIDFLYNLRKEEAKKELPQNLIANCEAFCGSALMAAGKFKCGSFIDILEDSILWSSFHPPIENLITSHYLLGNYEIKNPRVEVVHPVYDISEYMKREYSRALSRSELDAFIKNAINLQETHRDRNLILEYVERAIKHTINDTKGL